MAWNGNGTFVRTDGFFNGSAIWAQNFAAGIKIVADRHDTHDQDLAAGISNLVRKDGTTTLTGNLDLGGNSVINIPFAEGRLELARLWEVRRDDYFFDTYVTASDEGSYQLFSIVLNPALTSYTAGMLLGFVPKTTTTGPVKIKVNDLAEVDVFKSDGTVELDPGDITTDIPAAVVFDPTTVNKWILLKRSHLINNTEIISGNVGGAKIAAQTDDWVFDDGFDAGVLKVEDDLAAGTGQGTVNITHNMTSVEINGGNDVTLPAAAAGKMVYVTSRGVLGEHADVFPASGDNIADLAANASVQILVNGGYLFIGLDSSTWAMVGYQ
jgi:hypothetical protein